MGFLRATLSICLLIFSLIHPLSQITANTGRTGVWEVKPYSLSIPPAAIAFTGEIVSSPLRPQRFVTSDADVVDRTGKVILNKSSQLVFVPAMGGLKNSDPLFCNWRNIKYSSSPWRFANVSNKLICFMDKNADGKFEAFRECYSMYPAILIDGKCHDKLVAILDQNYTERDNTEFKTDVEVQTRFGRDGKISHCVGNASSECLAFGEELDIRRVKSGQKLAFPSFDAVATPSATGNMKLQIVPIETPRTLNFVGPWVLFDVWL
jgi:hypothetical protein